MEEASAKHSNQQQARVLLFPPLVGLTLAITAICLHLLVPLAITSASAAALTAGIIILACGIALQVICIRFMKRAETTHLFKKPSTSLLQSGPYARSRNPIYIAVFLQFSGLAFLINTWWLLAVLPVLYLYLRYGVIAREEQYLEQRFGEEYRSYQARVRRWL